MTSTSILSPIRLALALLMAVAIAACSHQAAQANSSPTPMAPVAPPPSPVAMATPAPAPAAPMAQGSQEHVHGLASATVITIHGKIVSVDRAKKQVTLEGPNGKQV